jgi:hypothetical protein
LGRAASGGFVRVLNIGGLATAHLIFATDQLVLRELRWVTDVPGASYERIIK